MLLTTNTKHRPDSRQEVATITRTATTRIIGNGKVDSRDHPIHPGKGTTTITARGKAVNGATTLRGEEIITGKSRMTTMIIVHRTTELTNIRTMRITEETTGDDIGTDMGIGVITGTGTEVVVINGGSFEVVLYFTEC